MAPVIAPPHPIHPPVFMYSCPLFLRVGWAQGLASNQQKTVDVRVELSGLGTETMMPSVPGPSCPLLSSPVGMKPAAMWVGGAPGPSPRGTASCLQPRGHLEARSPQPQWTSSVQPGGGPAAAQPDPIHWVCGIISGRLGLRCYTVVEWLIRCRSQRATW